MENRSFDVEDILDLTDSDDTSSSSTIGAFDQSPLIMDVHEVTKDDPSTETSAPDNKVKKLKKRKKVRPLADKTDATISSESTTEVNSLAPIEDAPKEEFFDAHESYHVIAGNQATSTIAGLNLSRAVSDHELPKVTNEQTSTTQPLPTADETDKKSSVITKPVTRNE